MLEIFDQIRPAERRAALAGLATLFGLMTGHLLLETARDAIFLSEIPATQLPLLYLAIAGISLALARLQEKISDRFQAHRLLVYWLAGSVTCTIVLWSVLDPLGWVGVYLLYLVPGVVSTVALIQFWVLLGNVLTMEDAKRMYVIIGAGGGLGAIAGSAGAAALSNLVSDPSILLAAAVVWSITPFGVAVMAEELPEEKSVEEDDSPDAPLLESLKTFLDDPYTFRIIALLMLLPMVSTFGDYLFKSVAADQIEAGMMATFFGSVYFLLNGLSLAIQLGLVHRIVRKFELATLLAVLPVLLAGGGAAVAAGAVFYAAIGLKVADGALRHSLHDTASELLYVPLSEAARSRLKSVTMVVGKRGGQALASIGLLGLVEFGFGAREIGAVVAVVGAGAAAAALSLRQPYVELFRSRLRDESVKQLFDFPELDVDSLETLISRLGSREDEEVLAAIDLLETEDRMQALPALILYHPSDAVVLRALDVFVERDETDVVPVIERREDEASPVLRSAFLSARVALDPSGVDLAAPLEDGADVVRATAAMHLRARGERPPDQAEALLDRIVARGSTDQRRVLAFGLGSAGTDDDLESLMELLDADDPRTQRAAISAMERIGDRACLASLRSHLDEREIRGDLFEAFVSMGDQGLAFLAQSLTSRDCDLATRRRCPEAIGRFDSRRAADILAEHLPDEPDDVVRAQIIEQLERLQFVHGDLQLDDDVIRTSLNDHLERAYRHAHWRQQLHARAEESHRGAKPFELLDRLLEDRAERALERTLRIVGLLYPNRDVDRARRGLKSSDRVKRASALELLESNLPSEIQSPILDLLERTDDVSEAIDPPDSMFDARTLDRRQLFADFLGRRSTELAVLGAEYAAEFELGRVVEPLRDSLEWMDEESREYVDYTIARIEYAAQSRNS